MSPWNLVILGPSVFEIFLGADVVSIERTNIAKAYPNNAKRDRVSPKNHWETAAEADVDDSIERKRFRVSLRNVTWAIYKSWKIYNKKGHQLVGQYEMQRHSSYNDCRL